MHEPKKEPETWSEINRNRLNKQRNLNWRNRNRHPKSCQNGTLRLKGNGWEAGRNTRSEQSEQSSGGPTTRKKSVTRQISVTRKKPVTRQISVARYISVMTYDLCITNYLIIKYYLSIMKLCSDSLRGDHSGIILKSFQIQSRIIMGSFWAHSAVFPGSFQGIPGSFWDHSGIISGWLQDHIRPPQTEPNRSLHGQQFSSFLFFGVTHWIKRMRPKQQAL